MGWQIPDFDTVPVLNVCHGNHVTGYNIFACFACFYTGVECVVSWGGVFWDGSGLGSGVTLVAKAGDYGGWGGHGSDFGSVYLDVCVDD